MSTWFATHIYTSLTSDGIVGLACNMYTFMLILFFSRWYRIVWTSNLATWYQSLYHCMQLHALATSSTHPYLNIFYLFIWATFSPLQIPLGIFPLFLVDLGGWVMERQWSFLSMSWSKFWYKCQPDSIPPRSKQPLQLFLFSRKWTTFLLNRRLPLALWSLGHMTG